MTAETTTKGHGDKRGRQSEQLIAALLTKPNIETAARASGISKATACRWLRDPTFQASYREARHTLLEATIGRLQAVTVDAVKTLHALLRCSTPSVRVAAARTILDFAWRAKELTDVEDRIAALEARFGEGANAP